jgi:hypothetical protein
MKRKFPDLKNGQVALIRVDYNTGIVLDENFKYATSDEQIVFTVFDSIDSALIVAQGIVKERIDVECSIFNESNQIINVVRPTR